MKNKELDKFIQEKTEEFIKKNEWIFHDPDCTQCEEVVLDDTGGKRVVGYIQNDNCCVAKPCRDVVLGEIESTITQAYKLGRKNAVEDFVSGNIEAPQLEKYVKYIMKKVFKERTK